MKKYWSLILLLIILLSSCKRETIENIEPNYLMFNGEIGSHHNSSIVSNDGNIIICTNLYDSILIYKLTELGSLIWKNQFYCGKEFEVKSLVQSSSGEIFICGSYYEYSPFYDKGISLIKMSCNGDTILTRKYLSGSDQYGVDIITCSDNKIVILGQSHNLITERNVSLIKVDKQGEIIWEHEYYINGVESPKSILETSDGGYIICGTKRYYEYSETWGLYLLKVDSSGIVEWDLLHNSYYSSFGLSIIEFDDEEFLICGGVICNGEYQISVTRVHSCGKVINEKVIGVDYFSEIACSMKQNIDKSFTITGKAYEHSDYNNSDIFVIKLDKELNQEWARYFGTDDNEGGVNIHKNLYDDILITGFYTDSKIFMTRLDEEGNFK